MDDRDGSWSDSVYSYVWKHPKNQECRNGDAPAWMELQYTYRSPVIENFKAGYRTESPEAKVDRSEVKINAEVFQAMIIAYLVGSKLETDLSPIHEATRTAKGLAENHQQENTNKLSDKALYGCIEKTIRMYTIIDTIHEVTKTFYGKRASQNAVKVFRSILENELAKDAVFHGRFKAWFRGDTFEHIKQIIDELWAASAGVKVDVEEKDSFERFRMALKKARKLIQDSSICFMGL